jgi:hypothetical protein
MAQLNFATVRLHTEKHRQSQKITTNHPNCGYMDINVQHNSIKQAHSMAHLNCTAIRLPHETNDTTQHKHDKNKHNNATMNCNKTTVQITNNQQHQRKTTTTTTTGTTTMTTENTNAGSTQMLCHVLRQATTTDCSKHRQRFCAQ